MSVRLVTEPTHHPLISSGSAVHGALRLNRPPRPAPCESAMVGGANGALFSVKRVAYVPDTATRGDWRREADRLAEQGLTVDLQKGSAEKIASTLLNSQAAELRHHTTLLHSPLSVGGLQSTQRAAQATAVLPKYTDKGNNANVTGVLSKPKTSPPVQPAVSERAASPSSPVHLPMSDLPTTASDYGSYWDKKTGGPPVKNVSDDDLWPTFERTSKRTGIGGSTTLVNNHWQSVHHGDFAPPAATRARLAETMANLDKQNTQMNSTAASLGYGPSNPHYRCYLAKGIDEIV